MAIPAQVTHASELGLVNMIGWHIFDSYWLGARPAAWSAR